jgi:hypothetical protein
MDSEDSDKNDEKKGGRHNVWKELPLPNRDTVIHDLSCQGSIGLALQQALVNQETELGGDDDTDINCSDKHIKLDQPAISQILQSFGMAVSHTQREQRDLQMGVEVASTCSFSAPVAVLRGRVDHFNRCGAKWRIMVHDAQIIERKPLDKYRRKSERPSIWEVMNETQSNPLKIRRLEILAYNDIE